jgi:GrpB-like predicted nucleotidyltransferase (UPF0157 family)
MDGLMNKNLDEMSNEELSKLFPIILSEHKSEWKESYLTEKILVEQAIGVSNIVRINHIGSTAVPGLIAKPTIDILVEIKDDSDTRRLVANMQLCGYGFIEKPENPSPHMMFVKGYTPQGFQGQVFHIHVRYRGDWDELYFKDYLLSHPEVSVEYSKLKLELQKEYKHNRDGYTNAKTDFIKRVTKLARVAFFTKYQ